MSEFKPELIEKLTEALRGVRMGDCLPEPLTPTSDEALDLAHAALEAVADDLRAEAWAEGKRAALRQADWEFGVSARPFVATNPYRKGNLS